MDQQRAVLLGAGTFVVCLALAAALFAALDVKMLYLIGPAIAIGIASHSAYRTAAGDAPKRRGG